MAATGAWVRGVVSNDKQRIYGDLLLVAVRSCQAPMKSITFLQRQVESALLLLLGHLT